MAESAIGELKKKKVSRRDFLKGGLAALAVETGRRVIPKTINWGFEELAGKEDHVAKIALASKVKDGVFSTEQIGQLKTLEELQTSLQEAVKELGGVSQAYVCIADGEKEAFVTHQTESDVFLPASVAKIPICYEAWKTGERENKSFLTEKHATNILQKSWTFLDMAMSLPQAKGKKPEQLEEVVRILFKEGGITPQNEPGQLPLRVNIRDLFSYIKRMKLPPIMKKPLLQTSEDEKHNYHVSTVLLDNLEQNTPAYFKLGLINDESSGKKELVNSYFFQIGDNLKVLGFAKGSDIKDVHEQMLQVAGRISSYKPNEGSTKQGKTE